MVQRLIRIAAAALALTLLAGAAGAQVPDPFAQDLVQRLARNDRILRETGFAVVVGPLPALLAEGDVARFPVTMRAGREYVVVGACDRRCADIDLAVTYAGALVGEDRRPDALPFVGARPQQTGAYTVELRMARCAAPSCYVAVNVLSR